MRRPFRPARRLTAALLAACFALAVIAPAAALGATRVQGTVSCDISWTSDATHLFGSVDTCTLASAPNHTLYVWVTGPDGYRREIRFGAWLPGTAWSDEWEVSTDGPYTLHLREEQYDEPSDTVLYADEQRTAITGNAVPDVDADPGDEIVTITRTGGPIARSCPVNPSAIFDGRGYTSGHRAVDLTAALGTRVHPIAAGTIIFAGWYDNGGGWQVWISHGKVGPGKEALFTTYNHLDRIPTALRGVRTVVAPSDTIGWVGSTGHSTGPHLHFEAWRGQVWWFGPNLERVYYHDTRFDPARYLTAACH